MRVNRFMASACLATVLTINAPVSLAEDNSIDPKWWVNFAMGYGTAFGKSPSQINAQPGAHISFNGGFNRHWFGTLYAQGFGKNGTGADGGKKDQHAGDYGVLVGYVDKKPKGYWSLASGICHYRNSYETSYWSRYYGSYNVSNVKSGAGLPLQAQAFWTPFRHFGLGLIAHSVVIPQPTLSLMLGIQLQG